MDLKPGENHIGTRAEIYSNIGSATSILNYLGLVCEAIASQGPHEPLIFAYAEEIAFIPITYAGGYFSNLDLIQHCFLLQPDKR